MIFGNRILKRPLSETSLFSAHQFVRLTKGGQAVIPITGPAKLCFLQCNTVAESDRLATRPLHLYSSRTNALVMLPLQSAIREWQLISRILWNEPLYQTIFAKSYITRKWIKAMWTFFRFKHKQNKTTCHFWHDDLSLSSQHWGLNTVLRLSHI